MPPRRSKRNKDTKKQQEEIEVIKEEEREVADVKVSDNDKQNDLTDDNDTKKEREKIEFKEEEKQVKDVKVSNNNKQKDLSDDEGSSSDSSVENYLKPAHEIDLNSTFFDFEKVETKPKQDRKRVLANVDRLSDSDDSESEPEIKNEETIKEESKSFENLNNYHKKIEEARLAVEKYNNSIAKQEKTDIKKLLSVGETKISETIESYISASSDEEMDWEDIENQKAISQATKEIPKEGVQITVEIPTLVRKKKQDDYLMQVRRRINRVKKENQVHMHKVHILCWIAHGNYLNSILNSENLLAISLSIIPSENCYPPARADLKYLEQITKWFSKVIKLVEKTSDKIPTISIEKILEVHFKKKEASSKRNLVLMFICILRALGLQCRLVLSLRCLPLKPPASELMSLSTKSEASMKNEASTSKESKESKEKEKEKKEPSSSSQNIKNNSKDKKDMTKCVVSLQKLNTEKSTKEEKSDNKSISQKEDTKEKENKRKSRGKENGKKDEVDKAENLKERSRSTSLNNKNKEESENTKTRNSRTTRTSGRNKMEEKNTKSPTKTKEQDIIKNPKTSKSKNEKNVSKTNPKEVINSSKTNDNKEISKEEEKPSQSTRRSRSKPNETQSTLKPTSKPKKSKSTEPKASTSKLTSKDNSDDEFRPDRRSFSSPEKKFSPKNDVRNDIINLIKGDMLERKQNAKQKLVRKKKLVSSGTDSDYMPEPEKKPRKSDSADEFKRKSTTKVKQRVKPRSQLEKIDKRVLSTDDEDDSKVKKEKEKIGNDIWAEVFLEAEEKWISVDVIKGQVHCVSELNSRASTPITYIFAWNNNLSIKDVTARYCPHMNTITRKLRIDSDWLNKSLKPFIGRKTARDKEEDEDLARQQLEQPLPKTIGEYKNHPLYALKRHLLKFEALYPPDAVTLGFVRNEAVYARECVHNLHSREIWIKHAKVVKPGEEPYKIVKARPKYDRLSGKTITDKPLEIFGIWQVEDYVPPTAENGIVPRNAFGNVELFKECMLPKGTVHLQLPGLNKICRRLRIDCAPALVGFDFHQGYSHPTFDGFVVCEEYKDQLIQAWEEEEEELERKEQEKIEKRVYDNWRKLIKGLLIREKLKHKYGFETASGSGKSKKKAKGPRFVAKKRRVVSGSESSS